MLLVTNPGTNVPPALVEEHAVAMLPQQIVVDDVHHDTRAGMGLQEVDAWVDSATVHPYVLGTSAAEFAGHLTRLSSDDPELLVIMTSRKIIQSYDACKTACKTLANHDKWSHLRISVVDSGSTDIAAGLVMTYAAMARAEGFDLEKVTRLTEEFASATRTAFVIQEMDNLVKGGRASFLKAWAAKFFGIRPVIAFVDGQLQPVGKYKTKEDPTDVLRDWVLDALPSGAGSRAWVGISHGQVPEQAAALADKLGAALEVEHSVVLPVSPSIYLHGGPGAILVAVTDLDGLSWVPSVP